MLGQPITAEMAARTEVQRHTPWALPDGTMTTTAEHDARKIKDATKRKAALDALAPGDEEDGSDDIEPIEVLSTPIPQKGRLFIGCADGSVALAATPGGARTVLNLANRIGWEVVRLTYARGPYIGSSGKSLGVSDSVVLLVRCVKVDGTVIAGVASWRDGKSDLAWKMEDKTVTAVGAKALIAWMKENPCGAAPQ